MAIEPGDHRFPAVDGVLVAFSGGKDSLAVLDLCCERYARVVAWHMAFLPGLDFTQALIDYCRERWDVELRVYQHFIISYFLQNGVFCEPVTVPTMAITDVEDAVRADTGLEWIAYGYRRQESLQRRGMLSAWGPGAVGHQRKCFAPIADWSPRGTMRYLQQRAIAFPPPTRGWDLTPQHLAWVKQAWPADYQRILEVFPYADYQVHRADAANAELRAIRVHGRRKSPGAIEAPTV